MVQIAKGSTGMAEMGAMFSLLKVRRGQQPGDYSDHGWYPQLVDSQAYEWTGPAPEAPRAPDAPDMAAPTTTPEPPTVRKPSDGHNGHHH